MNILTKLFGWPLQRIATTQVQAQQQPNLVIENAFGFIGDNQPLFKEDEFDYVLNAYEAVGAVYECVSLISNKILECPRLVYEIKDDQKYKQYKNLSKSSNPAQRAKAELMKNEVMVEVKVSQIEKLLNQPNPNQNGDEYDEMRIACLLLNGNSYMYGNGSEENVKKRLWSELFALPDMHIVSGGPLDPVKSYYMFWQTNDQKEFPADQIKHIKTVNPRWTTWASEVYGLSPLKAYMYQLDGIKNGNIQSDRQLKNGTEIGIITPKNKEDQLGKPQKDQIKENLQKAHASEEQISRLVPSSIPLEFLKISMSSADMQLVESLKLKAEDIYRAYHVPLYKRSMEQSALNNMKESGKQFIYDAVAPICTKLDAADTEFICTPYRKIAGKNYIIKRDTSSLPELSADMKDLADWLNASPQLTLNEKREAMGYGKSDIPGMDEILVPKTFVRLQDVIDGKTTGPDTTSLPSNA